MKVSKHIQDMEIKLWDKLEEYFLKGENKERGKVLVLITMAKELGVQGHADHIKIKGVGKQGGFNDVKKK